MYCNWVRRITNHICVLIYLEEGEFLHAISTTAFLYWTFYLIKNIHDKKDRHETCILFFNKLSVIKDFVLLLTDLPGGQKHTIHFDGIFTYL